MKKLTFLGLTVISFLFFNSNLQAQTEVSDKGLNSFVKIYKDVQEANQKFQNELIEMVQSEGMDVERFQEIQGMKADPNTPVEASEKELETHEQLISDIEEAQISFQEDVTQMIKDGGMSLEKYQEIFKELQQNEELQKKFTEMMQN